MKLDYAVAIAATQNITRAGFDFKKGKTRKFAKGSLSPAQLAQIGAVNELSLVVTEAPNNKVTLEKETN